MSNSFNIKNLYTMRFSAHTQKAIMPGKRVLDCKLDTGSSINVIPSSMLKYIKYVRGKRVPIRVTSASGHTMENMHEIIVPCLIIDDIKFKDVEFYVADYEDRSYCLLGMEFIRRINLLIKSSEQRVSFRHLSAEQITLLLSTDMELNTSELSIIHDEDEIEEFERVDSTLALDTVIQELNLQCKLGNISESQRILLISSMYDKLK